jgi:DNA-binding GntR family transcriptional regulator
MDVHQGFSQDVMETMNDTPKKLAAGTTLDYVDSAIRSAIVGGRYVPGQRLVEADLTRALGVSRGSVRESLRRLATEGLVETVPNQTAVVRRYSKVEILDLFEIRMEIEALGARRAAERIDQNNHRNRFIEATRAIWADHDGPISRSYFDENRSFHQAIADVSGNGQLSDLVSRMQLPLIMFQLNHAIHQESFRKSIAEHRTIAECILAGDADGAAREARQHLRRACDILDSLPSDTFRP